MIGSPARAERGRRPAGGRVAGTPAARRQRPAQRRLIAYLLLPRPGDAVKWWILPLGFGLGVLAGGRPDGGNLLGAALAWGVLELLVYQARYQWNDILGFAADQRHPAAVERGRLPGPVERARAHIRASGAVAVARVAAAAGVAVVLGSARVAVILGAATAGIFGVAAAYELLRSAATGRSGAVPAPLRPAVVATWTVVGAGYALRGVTGLALAIDLDEHPMLVASTLAMTWAAGVAFVTGRWALEALAFARIDDGRLVWQARAEHAREHTLALVRWLPAQVAADGESGPARAADWRPLMARTPIRAPWNLALVVAAASAGLTGRLLAGPTGQLDAVLAASAGGLFAMAVALAARGRPLVAVGAASLLALSAAGSPRPELAALPWLAVVAIHLLFTSQSLATLAHPLRGALARRGR